MYLGVISAYLVGYQSYTMYYLMDIMYSHVIDDEYYEMCTHAPQLTKSFYIFSEMYRV